ncbi:hypothetical protein ABEY65_03075 [Priestia aryabhattai]|uniref:hypothetical protein n=1 Tax=Priestia aryabhattai TaxID=412384 RepID=UPI002E221027|nr:hypothetical protein [Priestia aryabhattai]
MKLRHYTNSKESAISIINSQQLWLGKTGQALKDDDEINHYMKIFRLAHALDEIQRLLGHNAPFNPRLSLYETYILGLSQSYFIKKNQFMIGDVFSEIIRNESYIICFTNEDESNFHDSKYGPVSFVFKESPLREDLYNNFKFLQSEIIYIESDSFSMLELELNSFYENVLSPFLEIIHHEDFNNHYIKITQLIKEKLDKSNQKSERKKISKHLNKLIQKTSSDTERFNDIVKEFFTTHPLSKDKVSQIVDYLEKRVNNVREEKILSTFKEQDARNHRARRTFSKVPREGHLVNLSSCFVKDVRDEDDKETRIIALPSSIDENLKENKLKVDLNMSLLEKVIISPEIENREEVIEDIKAALQGIGLDSVEVE